MVDKPKLEETLISVKKDKDKQIELLDKRVDSEVDHSHKLNGLLQQSIKNSEISWYEHPVFWVTVGAGIATLIAVVVH